MDKKPLRDGDKKRMEKTPIVRRDNDGGKSDYKSEINEIISEKERKNETLSKNFSKLEKFNTSEIDKDALKEKTVSKKAYDIEKDDINLNKPKKKSTYTGKKKSSSSIETTAQQIPRPEQARVERKNTATKKTSNNIRKDNQKIEKRINRSELESEKRTRNPISTQSRAGVKRTKKRAGKPIIVGIVVLALVFISFSAVMVYNLLNTKKSVPKVKGAEKTEFMLDHESRLNVENQKLSGANITLRHSISEFFEDNVSDEEILKAMIYKKGLDGKFLTPDLLPRIEAASLYNEDVMGWLRLKDSNINMAVVQNTSGNDYYTWKGYDKAYSKHAYNSKKYMKNFGVLWAGARVELFGTREEMSRNTVIFGHNWENISSKPRIKDENDLMFEQLAAYVYTDFANENPYINFSNRNDNMLWVVIGAFYTEDYWGDYDKTIKGFNYITPDIDEAQTERFIEEVTKRSHYNLEDFEITKDDKFLTLTTCTRAMGGHDRQRFAVIAMLVDEKNLPDKVVYKTNENYKKPAV